MIQHEYWIRQEHEDNLMDTNFSRWEKLVKRRGYSLVTTAVPKGVRYLSGRDYAKMRSEGTIPERW